MQRKHRATLAVAVVAVMAAALIWRLAKVRTMRPQEGESEARISAATVDASDRRAFTNSIAMEFVLIPAGEFSMGATDSDEIAREDERPRRRVRICRAFYLSKCEVTVGQYRAFATASGIRSAAETDGNGASGYDAEQRGFEYDSPKYTWRNPGYAQDDDHPVVNVNWHDAQAFVEWLSKTEDRTYRLPTEAEWEYACRAGSTARFFLGNSTTDLRPMANLRDEALAERWNTDSVKKYGLDPNDVGFQAWHDGYAFTAPVGRFEANAFGLYDMLGNVAEFCSDWYADDYYRGSPDTDPRGPRAKKNGHVVRGGSFLNGTTLVRVTSRVECPELYRNYVIGFRVLLEVEGT